MAWVKLDDKFPEHPKVVRAGPLGLALHVAALCYCNRNLTDGFIPRAAGPMLQNFFGISDIWKDGELREIEWWMIIEHLVAAGVWLELEDKSGWRIHDYLDYQPSKEQVNATRNARAEAGKLGGITKAYGKPLANVKQTPSKPLAKVCPVPVPVSPSSIDKPVELDREEVSQSAKPLPKGTRWQATDKVPQEWIDNAEASRASHGLPQIDLLLEAERFGNYWVAATGPNSTKRDWCRTWINWALRANEGKRNGNGTYKPNQGFAAVVEGASRALANGKTLRVVSASDSGTAKGASHELDRLLGRAPDEGDG